MWRRIAVIGAGLVVTLAALLAVFVVSMRMKIRPVQDAVRRMNRITWNRSSMKTAGQPGADASVIRHVGRTTGTAYETPIGAVATDDGFVIALPYGTTSDWLKNVMAAGTAVIVNEGETHRVDHPELVAAAVANPYFPPTDQRSHRWFGVDDFLLVLRVEAG